jgi:hypothetical protein
LAKLTPLQNAQNKQLDVALSTSKKLKTGIPKPVLEDKENMPKTSASKPKPELGSKIASLRDRISTLRAQQNLSTKT